MQVSQIFVSKQIAPMLQLGDVSGVLFKTMLMCQIPLKK